MVKPQWQEGPGVGSLRTHTHTRAHTRAHARAHMRCDIIPYSSYFIRSKLQHLTSDYSKCTMVARFRKVCTMLCGLWLKVPGRGQSVRSV